MIVITLIFILLFVIAISRGIKNGATERDYIQFLMNRKPKIEYVIPVKREHSNKESTLNYLDYLREKREEEKTRQLLAELGIED